MDSLLLTSIFSGSLLLAIVLFYILNNKKHSSQSEKLAIAITENERLKIENEKLEIKNTRLTQELTQAQIHIAAIDTENTHLIKTNEQKEKEISELHNRLTKEFEDIANRVLINRSKEINEQNHKNINDILSPLKEKILV